MSIYQKYNNNGITKLTGVKYNIYNRWHVENEDSSTIEEVEKLPICNLDQKINLELTKDYITLTSTISKITNACNYKHILLIADTYQNNVLIDWTCESLYKFFFENSGSINSLDKSSDLDENKIGVNFDKIKNFDESSFIDDKNKRVEYFKKGLGMVEEILLSSTHIKCFFFLMVGPENTVIIKSNFIEKFFDINKRKIFQYLKKYFK
jgi:hypothetical protein